MGQIKTITIHQNGCVIIHIDTWYDNDRARNIKDKLTNGENIYVIYDSKWGWFWKCIMKRNIY